MKVIVSLFFCFIFCVSSLESLGQSELQVLHKPDSNAKYGQWYDYYKQQYKLYGADILPPNEDDPELAKQAYIEVKQDIKDAGSDKPPFHGGRIIGEIFIGGLAGMIMGLGGLFIAAETNGSTSEDSWMSGMFVGWIIGSSIGVYLVGNSDDETGSFLATLLGGTLFLPIAPIGATIGFNMTRRYKERFTESSEPRIKLPLLRGSF